MILIENKEKTLFNVLGTVGDMNSDIAISIINSVAAFDKFLPENFEREIVAIQSLNAGTWTLDISTNSLSLCNRCRQIVSICDKKSVKASQLFDLISSGYGKQTREDILFAVQTGSSFDVEVPVFVKDSSPKWLRITGAVAFNNQVFAQKIHGTVEDISERKNAELLKQDFLAMVSHDLRSPLSVINLYIQMCSRLAENDGNHVVPEMLEKAGAQVQKMNKMIQCYLDSSAMVAGKISHSPVMFDIKELLQEVIADLHILNPGYIFFLKPGYGTQVNADRDKIAQVLQNLLSNAIKYSSSMDVIIINFEKAGDYLQVDVKDHGIGIKLADQDKIFDRFYRVAGKGGATVKGYGIGLYLSKEIIKQHNGDIWLESEVNKGSKFSFTLPLS